VINASSTQLEQARDLRVEEILAVCPLPCCLSDSCSLGRLRLALGAPPAEIAAGRGPDGKSRLSPFVVCRVAPRRRFKGLSSLCACRPPASDLMRSRGRRMRDGWSLHRCTRSEAGWAAPGRLPVRGAQRWARWRAQKTTVSSIVPRHWTMLEDMSLITFSSMRFLASILPTVATTSCSAVSSVSC